MSADETVSTVATSAPALRPTPWWMRGAAILGSAAVFVGALGVLVHYVGPESNKLILLSSFVPLLTVVALVGTLVLLGARARRGAALGAVVVVAGAAIQAPLFVPSPPDTGERVPGEAITVLQANIRLGEGDASGLVDLVRDRSVDVLTIEEITDDAVVRLRDAGLEDLLPHQFARTRPSGGGGTAIYSRLPISRGESLAHFSMANLDATLDVGGGRTVDVLAVHPIPPYPSPAWMWAAEMERLGQRLTERPSEGPVIVSGDFNSTYSHTRYRSLLRDGYADAADQTGAGLLATFPADSRLHAVIGIDHVVTRDAPVSALHKVDLPGSDHHGLLAEVVPHFPATA